MCAFIFAKKKQIVLIDVNEDLRYGGIVRMNVIPVKGHQIKAAKAFKGLDLSFHDILERMRLKVLRIGLDLFDIKYFLQAFLRQKRHEFFYDSIPQSSARFPVYFLAHSIEKAQTAGKALPAV